MRGTDAGGAHIPRGRHTTFVTVAMNDQKRTFNAFLLLGIPKETVCHSECQFSHM